MEQALKAQLDAAKGAIAEALENKYEVRLAHYGAIDRKGTVIQGGNSACHASLPMINPVLWSVNARGHGELTTKNVGGIKNPNYREHGIRFVSWLISEDSPWHLAARHLMIADPEWIWDNGYIMGPGHLKEPGNIVYGFFIATRIATEHAHRLPIWIEMVDKGINPALATFGISVSTVDERLVRPMGHFPMNTYYSGEEYYVNLARAAIIYKAGPGYKGGVDATWGDQQDPHNTWWTRWTERYPELMGKMGSGYYTLYGPKTVEALIEILLKEQERLEIK